jgi:hypothetical protein
VRDCFFLVNLGEVILFIKPYRTFTILFEVNNKIIKTSHGAR